MKIREAAAILHPLLEGVDPDTGEVLPEEHLLQQSAIREALMVALQVMKATEVNSSTPVTHAGRLSASRPWTKQDLADLRLLYESGTPIEEIARLTHRRIRGVQLQLNLMAGGGTRQNERVYIPDVITSPSHPEPWTDEDTSKLRHLHERGLTAADIAVHMNRNEAAISTRLFYMGLTRAAPALFPPATPKPKPSEPPAPLPDKVAAGISPSRSWAAEDDAYLRQAWSEGVTIDEMCTHLGRRDRLVRCRLIYLGVADHSVLGLPVMPPELAHQGLPWYPEEVSALYHMFRQGRTVDQMAAALLRSTDIVRCRLEMLGLTTE